MKFRTYVQMARKFPITFDIVDKRVSFDIFLGHCGYHRCVKTSALLYMENGLNIDQCTRVPKKGYRWRTQQYDRKRFFETSVSLKSSTCVDYSQISFKTVARVIYALRRRDTLLFTRQRKDIFRGRIIALDNKLFRGTRHFYQNPGSWEKTLGEMDAEMNIQ